MAPAPKSRTSAFSIPEFKYLILDSALTTLGYTALYVTINFQVYQITKNPLSLGLLGFVEAIPSISLSLFGGYVADHYDRRKILLWTGLLASLAIFSLAFSSDRAEHWGLWPMYVIIFVLGVLRGFNGPAMGAFGAQVVPRELYVNASSWNSSVWQACSIIGAPLGGFAYAKIGPTSTYWVAGFLLLLSWFSIMQIKPKPMPVPQKAESIWASIGQGINFVLKSEPLVGSMTLDMFAVLFGGAIALLPIFAQDILHVGSQGYGWLLAAPNVGALLMMLWATRNPPRKGAGKTLLLCVAGFGVSIILFALSKNFYFSLVALFLTGIFDGISMVIRRSILQMFTPNEMRGRVSSVSQIFIGSSNELGAFESGVAAKILGTVRSVWLGGIVTLLVVGFVARRWPNLKNLSLEVGDIQNSQS